MGTIRNVRKRYGDIHLRFGAPIPLRTYLATNDAPALSDDPEDTRNPLIPKLAFEIAVRLNEATPVTPISLVATALLSDDDRSFTVDEVIDDAPLRRDHHPAQPARHRPDRPSNLRSGWRWRHRRAARPRGRHGVRGATDTVYRIGPDQQLAAAYYRNTIVHFFVNGAITELALIAAATHRRFEPSPRLRVDEALALRDLLKFEFFFAERRVRR